MGLTIAERPNPPDLDSLSSLPNAGVRRALVHMRVHCTRRLPLAEVASIAQMSPFHFSRLFHRLVGVTFQDHLVVLRLRHADHMIKRDPWALLSRVAAQTGFGTLRNLQDHYRRYYGHPPSQGRAKVRDDATRWGTEQHPSLHEHAAVHAADAGTSGPSVG
jgi:transcriptional regulator GlxA family with amidase domain